ncbi:MULTISPECIES: hypothetical protein [unclassified Nodularia (in: cyanobacteria)]|uniref:WD40 repeat domain-containing protein n=1 Tax=unclassified Nodularia (in: cyanobacteria) TaxID=2656917 RepID=UPI0018814FBB|nr:MULTISPECIES: hypothetical protein [unclassified Nodularia (in: cyanobacteria)]MBE9199326.1 hypothetical protein [Nodularia sp. LEGE 06071]MCC2694158.1 hypothetical protein [Nodularia sp. LEGE 04288]
MWNIANGECIKTFKPRPNWIGAVAFSPDGKIIVSGDANAGIKIWDLLTPKCVKSLRTSPLYESRNIYGITGGTEAQKSTLMNLGAVES